MGKTQILGSLVNTILTDSSNNVGIGGAANASFKLQVTGATNLTGALSGTSATFSGNGLFGGSTNAGNAGTFTLSVGVPGTTAGGLQLWAATNQSSFLQFGDSTTAADNYRGYVGYNHATDTLSLGTASADKLTIASTGAATFNTSATTAISMISTGTASGLQLNNTGGTNSNWIIQSDGGAVAGQAALRFYSITASAYRMSIDGNGNVGINETAPNARLDIVGPSNGTNTYGSLVVRNSSNSGISFGALSTSYAWIQGNLYGSGALNLILQASGGNVGIGTSSPGNFDGVSFTGPFLDVAGMMQIKGTSANTIAGLQFGGTTFRKALIYSSVGTDDPYFAIGVASSGSSSSATERMRITSGGNVGIRTSNPASLFSLGGTFASPTNSPINYTPSEARQGFFNTYYANSEGLFPQYLDIVSYGAPDGTNGGGVIRFLTNPVSSGSAAVERMRITSGGNVIVGSTTDSGYKFQVRGGGSYTQLIYQSGGTAGFIPLNITHNVTSGTIQLIQFNTDAANVGGVTTNGTTTSYNVTSDYRLKEDFKEINGLSKILAIKTYDFKWKRNQERMDGVIAHELKEILPYAVIGEKDDIKEDGTIIPQQVDYSKLVPILIKSIQEQQAQIEELTQKVNALENK